MAEEQFVVHGCLLDRSRSEILRLRVSTPDSDSRSENSPTPGFRLFQNIFRLLMFKESESVKKESESVKKESVKMSDSRLFSKNF